MFLQGFIGNNRHGQKCHFPATGPLDTFYFITAKWSTFTNPTVSMGAESMYEVANDGCRISRVIDEVGAGRAAAYGDVLLDII